MGHDASYLWERDLCLRKKRLAQSQRHPHAAASQHPIATILLSQSASRHHRPPYQLPPPPLPPPRLRPIPSLPRQRTMVLRSAWSCLLAVWQAGGRRVLEEIRGCEGDRDGWRGRQWLWMRVCVRFAKPEGDKVGKITVWQFREFSKNGQNPPIIRCLDCSVTPNSMGLY